MSSAQKSVQDLTIGFFGVGIMGEALLASCITAGIAPERISFSEKRDDRAEEISTKYGARRASATAVAECDVVMLVVKPQDLGDLLSDLGPTLPAKSLVVSFAAGKTTSFIESQLNPGISVIRVMPNTPLLIGKGMSVLSPGSHADQDQLDLISSLLAASGQVVQVAETLQDSVTAVSGSGPAYFFAFVEAMIKGGVELGLSSEIATQLTIQTLVGAAGMLVGTGKSATTLRENVTSPNGTTAAALKTFSEGQLDALVEKSMRAARDRSQELA
ncbi:MAG: pyrroline-5-carboxylate reductase [Actinomycetes bacterium]